MIFLGAGASKRFGIKTLQEMTDDLNNFLIEKGHGKLVKEISYSLNKFKITPDFEAIYKILDGLTQPEQAVKYYGPFTAYVCKNLEEIARPSKQNLENLLQELNNFIYEECKLKLGFQEVESVYDRLFKILKGKKEKRHFSKQEEGSDEHAVNVGYTVATTNYDMIIELYYWIKRQEYADGFRQTNNPLIKELDLTTYSQARQPWVIKLHGSIWQYKYENTIFKTNEDPTALSLPIKIQEKMMIYPTGEKPILKEPYHSFYNIFRSQYWNKLIVIGYSFRDYPVNIAILENLERITNSTVIVVDPYPDKAISNLGPLALSKFGDRIIPIKGFFGEEKVFDKIEEDAIKVESRKRYNERRFKRFKEKATR